MKFMFFLMRKWITFFFLITSFWNILKNKQNCVVIVVCHSCKWTHSFNLLLLYFLSSLSSVVLFTSLLVSPPSNLCFILSIFLISPCHALPCPPSLPCVLRVRQFIEMVNGTDSEVRCLGGRSPKSQDSYPGSPRPFSSPSHKASSSQPYLPGTVQLCSAYSHLEIRTRSFSFHQVWCCHTRWSEVCSSSIQTSFSRRWVLREAEF